MLTVLVTGHICVDITPKLLSPADIIPGELREIGAPRFSLGGCVANTGFDLIESGTKTVVEAVVGDDYLGEIARKELQRKGIDTSRIKTVNGKSTSYSIVFSPENIDRTLWHDPGANVAFDPRTVDLNGVDIMHIGYPPILPGTLEDDGAPLRDLLKRAKSLGITTSMDMAGVDPKSEGGKVNWNRFFELTMPYLDVFSPSVEDIFTARKIGRHATREEVISTAEELVGYGCAVVLLSDGENGLYLKTAGKDRLGTSGRAFEKNSSEWSDCAKWYDAINPEVFVSTLAAGDACSAGLLYAIAREMGPEQGAHFALAFPAVTIAGKITTEAEVLKIK